MGYCFMDVGLGCAGVIVVIDRREKGEGDGVRLREIWMMAVCGYV